MKLLKGWKLRILTGLALASLGGQVHAQMMPGGMDPSLLSGRGPMGPASYRIPGPPPGMMQDPTMAPMGMGMDPNLPMAGYGPAGMDGMPSGGCDGVGGGCGDPNCGCGGAGGAGGAGGGAGSCGAGSCGCGGIGGCGGPGGCGGLGLLGCNDRFGRDRCSFWGGIAEKLGGCRGKLRPFGEGGIATQRWFDVYGEAMFLKRSAGSRNFVTSTQGIGPTNPVLSTSQVRPDDFEAGLSLQANLQTGPGSNLELVYFGLNEWESNAQATSTTPSLFSFMSAFGTAPNNGFDDPDRSFVHTLSYKSELHNGEINFRRRWAEPNGFLQGSFLMGVRYMDIDETARFTARGEFNDTFFGNSPRFFDYTTMTQNSLVGFQVGADLWYNVVPGVKLGIEGKTGVYNNRMHQDTRIFANSVPEITETLVSNRAAYITQLSPQAYYRLNYSLALRGSYQLMFIDNVSLATDTFNATRNPRVPRIENDGEITLQGFTSGVEYTW